MNLFLVRHGATAWTVSGQHTGTTDLPLLPEGIEQAEHLKTALASHHFAHVFTSPLVRARETCRVAGYGDRATVADELREWNYGRYEGWTSQQIYEENPSWNLFVEGAPGGEQPADIQRRVDALLAKIKTLSGPVLIFSSGHLLRALAARWLGHPLALGAQLSLAPGTLSILGTEHGLPALVSWNHKQLKYK